MNWLPKQKVVVPVDFSDDSFAAVDVAMQLAATPDGVHLIHVLPEPSEIGPGVEWLQLDNENRRLHADEALRARLSDAKYDALQIEIDFGDPGYRIADYAQRIGADLVVIPSHGRTGFKRILVGSVAERVIRLSHCPVLVLRK